MTKYVFVFGLLACGTLTFGAWKLLNVTMKRESGTPISKQAEETAEFRGLTLFHNACVREFEEISVELNSEWEDGGADAYCTCAGTQILLNSHNKADQDVLDGAKALIANKEVFRGFLRLEKIAKACLPGE